VTITVLNSLYAYAIGRTFWLIAGATAGTLMLFALRDFLDYGPLFQRYVEVAGNLQEIDEAYAKHQVPFHQSETAERLRRLVEYVEQTLSSEFQYWYASRH
jgi:hypothetical protein